MKQFLPTIILRHRKENLKKCSLRSLEGEKDFLFFTYPKQKLPTLSNYLMLSMDAPLLSPADKALGLFLIDATWKYAATMQKSIEAPPVEQRSLPPTLRTAYPRKQTDCSDPDRGLASIEALYVACKILGHPNVEHLLNDYYWKDLFLETNRDVLANL